MCLVINSKVRLFERSTYVFGPFKLFHLFPAVLRYDGDPAGIAAYQLRGASKARMRSGLCAIVFTQRIVAKTRAAQARALFDSHCDCRLLANKRVALFLLLDDTRDRSLCTMMVWRLCNEIFESKSSLHTKSHNQLITRYKPLVIYTWLMHVDIEYPLDYV